MNLDFRPLKEAPFIRNVIFAPYRFVDKIAEALPALVREASSKGHYTDGVVSVVAESSCPDYRAYLVDRNGKIFTFYLEGMI